MYKLQSLTNATNLVVGYSITVFSENIILWINGEKRRYRRTVNPNAIELLEKNPNKIYWTSVSSNLNAIDFLENNQNKLDGYSLS